MTGGGFDVVHLEVFDYKSWPQCPEYNVETATRHTVIVHGRNVKHSPLDGS